MRKIFYLLFVLFFIGSLFGEPYIFKNVYFKYNENSDWQPANINFLTNNKIKDFCYYRLSFNFDDLKEINDPALLLGRVEGSIRVKINGIDCYNNYIDTRNNYFRLNKNLKEGINNVDIVVSLTNSGNSGKFSILPVIENYTTIDTNYKNRSIIEISLALFIVFNSIIFLFNFSKKIKNYENIFFALISIISFIFMILRSQFQFYLFDTLHINFIIIRRLVSISLFLIPCLSVYFFSIVFIKKNRYNLLIANCYFIITFFLSIIGLLAPYDIMPQLMNIFRFLLFLFFIYVIYYLIRNVFFSKKYFFLLSGFIFIIIFGILDITQDTHIMNVFDQFRFFNIGFTLYILCQGLYLSNEFKELNINLYEKVKSRTYELETAKNQIEQQSQQKTDFFINLAHETKTPLSLITNYLEKYIKEHERNDDLLIIKQNIEKLKNDMVNYLDIEKIKNNQIFYNHEQICNLSRLIYDKNILFKETALQKNIDLQWNIENDLYLN